MFHTSHPSLVPYDAMTSARTMVRRRRSAWITSCFIGGLAVLALASGCNKARRSYPTISAVNPDGGNVNVRGTYNHCPQVFYSASPTHAAVGQTISLMASASDSDGDPLTYSWTADGGTIDDPKAPKTLFHCTTRGAFMITLTVSDGLCPSMTSGQVLCQSEDAGAPDDGGAAGAGGAAGTGGAAGVGGSTGTAGTTGNGGTTGAGGSAAGSIGTGTGGSVGAGGTTGTGGAGAGGTGGGACIETNPPPALVASCTTCLAANASPMTDGCCGIQTGDPTGYTLCQAASACIRGNMCNNLGDTTSCYCGTHAATCDTNGQPNGPCVSEISAAAGRNINTHATDTPTAAQVEARYGDPSFAIGRAVNIQNVAGAFCTTECGYDQ